MQRINHIDTQAASLEKLLTHVLEVLLDILNCHNVLIIQPCDPLVPECRILSQISACPSNNRLRDKKLQVSSRLAAIMQLTLQQAQAVVFNPKLPEYQQYQDNPDEAIDSLVAIAIRLKSNTVWLLNVEFNTSMPAILNENRLLLNEIAQPIANTINTFLAYEALRQVHKTEQQNLSYLDALYRISQIIFLQDEMQEMLSKILQEILEIFSCDRAWLLYPCDPDTKEWSVPAEQTRPEWLGANAEKSPLKINTTTRMIFQAALDTDGVVTNDIKEDENFRNGPDIKMFSVRSQMMNAIYPRRGKPWLLGLHYCAEHHSFSIEESKKFEAISHRIADAITSCCLTLKESQESEARYRTLVENAPEAIVVYDAETGKMVDANENAFNLLCLNRQEYHNVSFFSLGSVDGLPSRSSSLILKAKSDLAVSGNTPVFEWELSNGTKLMPCEIRLVRLPSKDSTLIRGSISDISERKKYEAQNNKLSSALKQTADAIAITNKQGVIEYINPACEKMTGYVAEELIGQNMSILRTSNQSDVFYQELWASLRCGKIFNDVVINRRKNSSVYYEQKSITPLKDGAGCITHFISTGKDITETIKIQERLTYPAHHDTLTALPNRIFFIERLNQALSHAKRGSTKVAVLFIDLDRFKYINDTLGHDIGDKALQLVAKKIIPMFKRE